MNTETTMLVGIRIVKWVLIAGLISIFGICLYFQDYAGLILYSERFGVSAVFVGLLFLLFVGAKHLLSLSAKATVPNKVFRIFNLGEFLALLLWLIFGMWNIISPMQTYKGATVIPILGRLGGIGIVICCLWWTWQCYKKQKSN